MRPQSSRGFATCALAVLCGAATWAAEPPSAAELLKRNREFTGALEEARFICEGVLEMGQQRYRFEETWDGPGQKQSVMRITAPNGRALTVVTNDGAVTRVVPWIPPPPGVPAQDVGNVNRLTFDFTWGTDGSKTASGVEPSPLGDGAWRMHLSDLPPDVRVSLDVLPDGAMVSWSMRFAVGAAPASGGAGNAAGAFTENVQEFADYRKLGPLRIPFLASLRVNGVLRTIRRFNACREGEAARLSPGGGAQ